MSGYAILIVTVTVVYAVYMCVTVVRDVCRKPETERSNAEVIDLPDGADEGEEILVKETGDGGFKVGTKDYFEKEAEKKSDLESKQSAEVPKRRKEHRPDDFPSEKEPVRQSEIDHDGQQEIEHARHSESEPSYQPQESQAGQQWPSPEEFYDMEDDSAEAELQYEASEDNEASEDDEANNEPADNIHDVGSERHGRNGYSEYHDSEENEHQSSEEDEQSGSESTESESQRMEREKKKAFERRLAEAKARQEDIEPEFSDPYTTEECLDAIVSHCSNKPDGVPPEVFTLNRL